MRKALTLSMYALVAALLLPAALTMAYGGGDGAPKEPPQPTETRVSATDFIRALGGQSGDTLTITRRTDDGRVAEAAYGGKTYTAAELAAALGLPGASFTVRGDGGDVVFTVYTDG